MRSAADADPVSIPSGLPHYVYGAVGFSVCDSVSMSANSHARVTMNVRFSFRRVGLPVLLSCFWTMAAVAQSSPDSLVVASQMAIEESLTTGKTDTAAPVVVSIIPVRDTVIERKTHIPRVPGVPVVLDGDTLFRVYPRALTAAERAERVNRVLQFIVESEAINPTQLQAVDGDSTSDIVLDTLIILSITDDDAAIAGVSRSELAERHTQELIQALTQTRREMRLHVMLIRLGLAILILAGVGAAWWLLAWFFPRVYSRIRSWKGKIIRPLRIGQLELVSAATATAFSVLLAQLVRWTATLFLLYFGLARILNLFPATARWNVRPVLIGVGLTILATFFAWAVFRLLRLSFGALLRRVSHWKGTLVKGIRLRSVEILSEDRLLEIIEFGIRVMRFAVYVVLSYGYLTLVFSFFSFTRTWSATLFRFVMNPLVGAGISLVNYLPSLFTILVIILIARYAIKLVHWIFSEIGKGTIPLPGFYPEWADPTYKIARFLVVVFAVIVIFPYLPGSSSRVFQGISIFVGVVFSLGSTSAIANIVAGVIMTYMRPFKVGDRVKIADTMGDVVEKTLLVTRVRTIKNVDITVPNAMVLGSHIINFSSAAQEQGLILHTTVTIGYDAPWRKVHELLLAAAAATPNVLKEPAPFILQTALNDFYVSYELNAYTDQPGIMAKTYSELHQSIQDKFFEAGVEIMSPHYSGVRDGNRAAIPDEYLPKGYQVPPFRVSQIFGKKEPPAE
ncbi:mechanosensitive ion channel family protein [bacterium]|nr:mechanosensitive ion channel family protein [bacterium]